VAAEVARAHANLESATSRVEKAEAGLQEAQLAYAGSLNELGKITQVGDVRVLTRRAFEVVDALQALSRAYDAYFLSVNDYNRAQFRLYRALVSRRESWRASARREKSGPWIPLAHRRWPRSALPIPARHGGKAPLRFPGLPSPVPRRGAGRRSRPAHEVLTEAALGCSR